MVVASALFAGMNVSARLASRSGVAWQEVALARASLGVVMALSTAIVRRRPLRVHDGALAWQRSLFGTAALVSTFFVLAAKGVPLGDVVTLGATSPVFLALLSPRMLGERVGRRVWAATPIAFVGVALVVQPSFHTALPIALAATFSALMAAFAMISLRKMGPGESAEAIVLHFQLVATLVSLLAALPVLRVPSPAAAAALVATGVLGGLAQLAMTRAYSLDRAARLSAVGYLGIVLTQLLAVPLLGETQSPTQLVGSAFVIGAGLVLALGALREAPTP